MHVDISTVNRNVGSGYAATAELETPACPVAEPGTGPVGSLTDPGSRRSRASTSREHASLLAPRAAPRKIHDHVVLSVELQRERSVGPDLGQAVLLVDVADDRLGRFVKERDQERDYRVVRQGAAAGRP